MKNVGRPRELTDQVAQAWGLESVKDLVRVPYYDFLDARVRLGAKSLPKALECTQTTAMKVVHDNGLPWVRRLGPFAGLAPSVRSVNLRPSP